MNGIGVGAVLMEKRKPVLYNLCLAELDDIHFPKTPFFGVKLGDLKADSKKNKQSVK